MKSSETMILALVNAISATALRIWKVQNFNGVWTRDLAMPVRRSYPTELEWPELVICGFKCSRDEWILRWLVIKWWKYANEVKIVNNNSTVQTAQLPCERSSFSFFPFNFMSGQNTDEFYTKHKTALNKFYSKQTGHAHSALKESTCLTEDYFTVQRLPVIGNWNQAYQLNRELKHPRQRWQRERHLRI